MRIRDDLELSVLAECGDLELRCQAQFITTSSTCPACYRPRTECEGHHQ